MPNLSLYFVQEDYDNLRGPDWPDYQSFLKGDRGPDPTIQAEIQGYLDMFRSQGIKFPIKSKTACQSKWTWSTIYLNQMATASCHRVDPVKFDLDQFDNFHNLPKKIQDRQLMLRGEWPSGGCEYCRSIEESGGWSDRQHNLDIRDLTPPEVENDLAAVRVTPRIVEIFAQNTCNLRCTYCNSNLSSKIQQENIKFGNFNHQGVTIPVTSVPEMSAEYFERFMSWLGKNIKNLKRLHLLGGETFLQHDLMTRTLDTLEKNANPDLQLCIFSNLNVPDRYWNLYTERIRDLQRRRHIRCFDLTASIDCWGPQAEYARFGLDLGKFEQRLSWAADQDPDWLRLNCNQTLTCLTMRAMPELIDKIREYSKNRHIGHYFQFYTGPQMWQHPKTFAYEFWQETFDKIFQAMPSDTHEQREAIPRMQGLQKFLQTFRSHDWNSVKKLHIYLDELDRRRGTQWRSIFPYLDIQQ